MNELVWAAGFFDGEGSVYASPVHGRPKLFLEVTQVDRRPVDRFAKALGVGSVRPKRRTGTSFGTKDRVRWIVSGRVAHGALARLWPYLSEPKREQAARARLLI